MAVAAKDAHTLLVCSRNDRKRSPSGPHPIAVQPTPNNTHTTHSYEQNKEQATSEVLRILRTHGGEMSKLDLLSAASETSTLKIAATTILRCCLEDLIQVGGWVGGCEAGWLAGVGGD